MAKIHDRVLVFAGAGASKAVNSSQFPTTKEFFDRLSPRTTDDQIFQFALNYLRSQEGLDTVDIEHVLWALQELYDFYLKIESGKGLGGYATKYDLIGQLFPRHNVGHLLQLTPQMRSRVGTLISSINEIVYDLYGYEPTPDELNDNWSELIARLDGVGVRLDLFTTNYDVVIEAALNDYAGDVTARDYRGIRGTMRQSLQIEDWGRGARWQPVLLTKLHGSLDWKYGSSRINVGDAVFTGDHTKHAIIYPGFKGTNDAPFFDIFHNYLGEAVADAKAIVFIGFAFRDEYINQVVRENIRPNCNLIVINPDPSIKLPMRRTSPKYIHEPFGTKALDQMSKLLGIDT